MTDNEPETQPATIAAGDAVSNDPPSSGAFPTQTPVPKILEPTKAAEIVPVRKRIGRYSIISDLGRGGMGRVYLARQEDLNRHVALKVIPSGPAGDEQDLARFRAEAETAASLRHHNIVQVYEVGETDGVAYLAMEYIEGGSLNRRMGGRPVDPLDAAYLVETIGRAVQFAHERSVIHRDIKPSNILLAKDPTARFEDSTLSDPTAPISPTGSRLVGLVPKLADFGLAKRTDQPLGLTATGVAVGTPQYMAPEQARGQADRVGPATDVYALGVVLYEMLVGTPPFGAGLTVMETMEQVVNRKPIAPGKLRSGLPRPLEEICLKCLEKAPAKRFARAAELVDALHRFRTEDARATVRSPIVDDTSSEQRGMGARPNRVRFATVAFGLLAMALGSGWAIDRMILRRSASTAPERSGPSAVQPSRLSPLGDPFVAKVSIGVEFPTIADLERVRRLAGESGADPAWAAVADQWAPYVITRERSFPSGAVNQIAYHPLGKPLLLMARGSDLVLWDREHQQAPVIASGSVQVTAIAWSPDGRRVVAGRADGSIDLIDAETRKPITIESRLRRTEPIESIRFHRDGQSILAAALGGSIETIPLGGGASTLDKELTNSAANRIWRIEAEVTAVLQRDAKGDAILLWDSAGPRVPAAPLPAIGPIRDFRISADGRVIYALTENGKLTALDRPIGRWVDFPPGPPVDRFTLSADGNVIAAVTDGRTVRLWDAVSRTPLSAPESADGDITALAFSPDSRRFAVIVNGRVSEWVRGDHLAVAAPIRVVGSPTSDPWVGLEFGETPDVLYTADPRRVYRWKLKPGPPAVYVPDGQFTAADRTDPPSQEKFTSMAVRRARGSDPEAVWVSTGGTRNYLVNPLTGRNLFNADSDRSAVERWAFVDPGSRVFVSMGLNEDRRGFVEWWPGDGLTAVGRHFEIAFPIGAASLSGTGEVLRIVSTDGRAAVGLPLVLRGEPQAPEPLADWTDPGYRWVGANASADPSEPMRSRLLQVAGTMRRRMIVSADGRLVPTEWAVPLRVDGSIEQVAVCGDCVAVVCRASREIRVFRMVGQQKPERKKPPADKP